MKTLIIAGITRSGLTLTMQMLHAGGYPCAGEYPAFEGFGIGQIPWDKCFGKAIKVVDTHMQFPPPGEYSVIRLRRSHKQQAKSQMKLINVLCDIPVTRAGTRAMEQSLPKDYSKIDAWAAKQKELLTLDFEELILEPNLAALKLIEFTGAILDIDKMMAVVVKRGTDCYPTLLESTFLPEKN